MRRPARARITLAFGEHAPFWYTTGICTYTVDVPALCRISALARVAAAGRLQHIRLPDTHMPAGYPDAGRDDEHAGSGITSGIELLLQLRAVVWQSEPILRRSMGRLAGTGYRTWPAGVADCRSMEVVWGAIRDLRQYDQGSTEAKHRSASTESMAHQSSISTPLCASS